jgi:hypothetical protein
VTLWERVVIGRLRVLEWQNVNISNTEVADKQCGGLQTRVDVGALPTLRAIYKRREFRRPLAWKAFGVVPTRR